MSRRAPGRPLDWRNDGAAGVFPATVLPCAPRTRMISVVGVVAALAGGAVVGDHRLSDERPATAARASAPSQRPGPPPLSLDLGVRTDREAVDLREALRALRARTRRGRRRAVRAARLARGAGRRGVHRRGRTAPSTGSPSSPGSTRRAPSSSSTSGIARLLGRRRRAPRTRGSRRRALEPDTAYAVIAGQPAPPGLRAQPADLRPVDRGAARPCRKLAAPAQRRRCSSGAHGRARSRSPLLRRRAAAARESSVSAERVFARGRTKAAPNDPEARVAAAVGLFDKARRPTPSPASARSRARFRRPPPCASTSACCCSGRAR